MTSNSNLKILLTLSFLLIIVINVLISLNPMHEYEISLYSASPLIWFLLILNVSSGIFIVLWCLRKESNLSSLWIAGLFLIILSNLIILLLPIMRGYQMILSKDYLFHIGFAIDVLKTGTINNEYPVTEIIISFISLLINIPPRIIMTFIGPFFYVLFIIYNYILAKSILNKKIAILASVASTMLFVYYYYQVFPMGLALISLIVLIFSYLEYIKTKKPAYVIVLVILIIAMVFFHPVISFITAIMLLIFELSKFYVRKYKIKEKNISAKHDIYKDISFNLALISIIVLLMWLWNIQSPIIQSSLVWEKFVESIINLFQSELMSTSLLSSANNSISLLNLSSLNQILLFVKVYGHIAIYSIISLIALFLIIFRTKFVSKKLNLNKKQMQNLFILSIFFLFAFLISYIDLFHSLTELSSGRLIDLTITLFPIFVGLILFLILNNEFKLRLIPKFRTSGLVFTFCILLICSLIGIFSIYNSPIIYQPSEGVTSAQIQGTGWLVNNANPNIRTISLSLLPISAYAISLKGFTGLNVKDDVAGIGDHFNYTNNSNLGNLYTSNRYLILRKDYLITLYSTLYPQIGRYNENDFDQLDNDNSTNEIYDNGEIETWFIISRSS